MEKSAQLTLKCWLFHQGWLMILYWDVLSFVQGKGCRFSHMRLSIKTINIHAYFVQANVDQGSRIIVLWMMNLCWRWLATWSMIQNYQILHNWWINVRYLMPEITWQPLVINFKAKVLNLLNITKVVTYSS